MASIMVVEDDTVVATILERSLRAMGYPVAAVVASGEAAIERAAQTRPDLALMDMVLTGPLDGVDTAHVLRERFGVPVVYLTAYDDDPRLERAKATGAFGYLVKPFEARELRSTIEIALHKHRVESEQRRQEEFDAHELGDALGSIMTKVQAVATRVAQRASMPPPTRIEPRGHILVVDDEPLVAAAIRRVLGAHHHTVVAHSAEAALAKITAGVRFDVVLCDLMMPDMSGAALHAELERRFPETAARMVFLTGGAYTEEARAFLARVGNRSLKKPFDFAGLRAMVRERLAAGEQGALPG